MKKNEIMLKNNQQSNIVVPNFDDEASTTDLDVRKIKISVTKGRKKTGETFNKVFGYVIMDTYSKNGYVGLQVHKLEMHFKKQAFKGAKNVHSPEDLSSGYLYVDVEGARIPTTYKITDKKDKDGKVIFDEKTGKPVPKFPTIWIENGVIGLERFKVSQDALDVANFNAPIDAEENIEYNEDTGEVIEDLEDIKEAVSDTLSDTLSEE